MYFLLYSVLVIPSLYKINDLSLMIIELSLQVHFSYSGFPSLTSQGLAKHIKGIFDLTLKIPGSRY